MRGSGGVRREGWGRTCLEIMLLMALILGERAAWAAASALKPSLCLSTSGLISDGTLSSSLLAVDERCRGRGGASVLRAGVQAVPWRLGRLGGVGSGG